jgi:hypothetical protein
MGSTSVIGALRVILGADASGLRGELKGAESALGRFAAGWKALAASLGVGLGFGAIASSISSAAAQMDKLGKTAQSIGIPVEQLSALSHAAALSDVSIESLSKGVGRLSKAMVEAAANPTSDVSRAFQALGVSVTESDGRLKSSTQVMTDIAGRFENLKDGAGKTAVSMALFGKSGADLIPLLNSGKSGLAEMVTEAEKLGLTFGTDTSKAAEAFNDNLTRLGKVKDGIIIQITARMLPALQSFTDRMVEVAKDTDVVNRVATNLQPIFEGVARGIMFATDNFGALLRVAGVFIGSQIAATAISAGIAFVKFASAIRLATVATLALNAAKSLSIAKVAAFAGIVIYATGNMPAFTEALEKIGTTIAKMMPEGAGENLRAMVQGLGVDLSALEKEFGKLPASSAGAAKAQEDFNYKVMAGKNALQSYLESQAKQQAARQAEIAAVGMAAGAQERLKVAMEARAIAEANGIPFTEAMRLKVQETALAAGDLALKLQGVNLVQQMGLAPWQQYQMEVENARLALERIGATAEQQGLVLQNIAERYGATWQQVGANAASGFAQLAQAFGKNSAKMATAAKVFGVIEATINTYTAFTKALASAPPPLNYVAAAGVLAAGMAKVMAIKSQAVPSGMMTGGAMMVRGRGGPDSVPVSFMASPGEQVDVWRPDQGGGADPRRGAGAPTQVNLAMPIATTREALRDVIDGLNEMFADGYRLKIAAV